MLSYHDIFQDKSRVLFVSAHPDDVDVAFGGLVGLLNHDHKETYVLITTNGARGSKNNIIAESELAGIRLNEEKTALAFLNQDPAKVVSLNYPDGEIDNNFELIGQISAVIRRFRPEIVCTHEPNSLYFDHPGTDFSHINHRDHRVTGTSVLDAVYPFSRDKSFFPGQNFGSWQVNEILLTGEGTVNTQIDITAVAAQKRQALLAHQSQFDPATVDRIMSFSQVDDLYLESGHYLKLPW